MKDLLCVVCVCASMSSTSFAEAQSGEYDDTYDSSPSAAARAIPSFTFEPSTTIDLDPAPSIAPQLVLDGTMRFYAAGNGQRDVVQIDVSNHGALPATESEVTIEVMGTSFAGTLYQYFGGTANTAYTVNGGERGYVRVEVGRGLLQECQSPQVTLHLPAQNDELTRAVATQCPLRWTTPIDAKRLGATPDPLVLGKTLQDIVSSRVQGSAKGLCSNCHNRDAAQPPYYKPNIARGATTLIEPLDPIGNHIGSPNGTASWAFGGTNSSGGSYYSWAQWFISRNDKPEGLKQVLKKWIADGWQR